MNTADKIIREFGLEKHPEGGYYKQVYKSKEIIHKENLPSRFNQDHAFATSIYFLLKKGDFSAFHQIHQDEVWHFYGGAAITIHILNKKGEYETFRLGNKYELEEKPQGVVEAECVFGATVEESSDFDYSFVGCSVSPGFEFEDFCLLDRHKLISLYPKHEKIIERLTRDE